jgi:hypothetical protein
VWGEREQAVRLACTAKVPLPAMPIPTLARVATVVGNSSFANQADMRTNLS